MRADDVHDAVGADGARVFIVQADAGANPGADNQRADVEVTLAHLAQRHDERRHNGRDDDRLDVLHADILIPKEFVDEDAVLVDRLLPIGRNAPVAQEFPALICAHDNVAVADVQYQ